MTTIKPRVRPREAARLLGVAANTLRCWRVQGKGPAFYKEPGGSANGRGARVWYFLDDIQSYLDSIPRRLSTSDKPEGGSDAPASR